MRTTLAALSIRFLAGALFAAIAAPVSAQSEEMIATVPFDFVVGAQHLPAGRYVVKPASEDPSIVMIESADGRRSALTSTIPAAAAGSFDLSESRPTLTFAARGAQHVLARVVEADGSEREVIGVHP